MRICYYVLVIPEFIKVKIVKVFLIITYMYTVFTQLLILDSRTSILVKVLQYLSRLHMYAVKLCSNQCMARKLSKHSQTLKVSLLPYDIA